jgi:hypothetical protein
MRGERTSGAQSLGVATRRALPLANGDAPAGKRGPIREDEGDGLTGIDRELTDCFEIVNVKRG